MGFTNRDMCKFESSQKDERRWQSTDSSKAYRNTSAFKCHNELILFTEKLTCSSIAGLYCFVFNVENDLAHGR